jgi:PadR family transcriptional regulator AphA
MSLKHAILVLLETEPGSGYDLLKQFKNRLGYFWNAKHQQIYQQLKQLTEQKQISYSVEPQKNKPDKKIYRISNKGIKELKDWITAPVKPAKVNDALLVKIYGGHLTNDENLLSELKDHLETHRQTLFQLQQIELTYQSLTQAKKQNHKLPYLTLRRGIIGEQAWITWINEAIEAIDAP